MASAVEIERLAAEIGENIYIDVAGWHLYLAEAHLHTQLAEKLMPLVEDNDIDEAAISDALRTIQVPLGGKQAFVPLPKLIPAAVQQDLVKLLEEYQRNY